MNPILREVSQVLETERCRLRSPQEGDGKVVNEAIVRSIPELKPWLPFVQTTPTIEDTEQNTREALAKFMTRESLRYLIFTKDGEFVGSTGFHNLDWDVRKLEIGYWIDTAYSGKGYVREAVQKLTDFAMEELGFVRVEIRCESENLKSRAVPESLGYELEGILKKEDLSVDGTRLTDTCVYAMVCEDTE
ncbi:N-acetyltransferase [Halobacillus fulvus]|nr:N-acetyltransferase [Halobacillus fulvus]